MLIDRYVLREIAVPGLLGLFVYTAIFLVNFLFGLADQWASGVLSLAEVARALAYFLPSILAQTLPMSVLLGVLIGFSRLSADCEITALRASGVSYYRLLVPALGLAVAAWATTFGVYVLAVPWANTRYVAFRQEALQRADLNREVRPGTWTHLGALGMESAAVFARGTDLADAEEPWLLDADLLVIDTQRGQAEHWRAGRARIQRVPHGETASRLRFLLEDVRAVTWRIADPTGDVQVSRSKRLDRLGAARPSPALAPVVGSAQGPKDARLKSLTELRATLRDLNEMDRIDDLAQSDPGAAAAARRDLATRWEPRGDRRQQVRWLNEVEIHKKHAIPFACLVFALCGMPLGMATRRGGRPAAFAISIGIILAWWMVYSGAEAWMKAGKLAPAVAAWLPNAVLLVVGVSLLVGLRRRQRLGLVLLLRDLSLLCAAIGGLLGLALLPRWWRDETATWRDLLFAWPVLTALALLVLHALLRVGADRVARMVAVVGEPFRMPRPPTAGEPAVPASHVGATAPAAAAPAPRRRLERLRAGLVFGLLALLALSTLQALQHAGGLAEGVLTTLRSPNGLAIAALLAACAVLQVSGIRIVKTLDWWVLSGYLRLLVIVLASLAVLYFVRLYVDLASSILQNDIAPRRVLAFFVQRTPKMLFELLPLAAMVAALGRFGLMAKFNETTALRCAGLSAHRLVLPVVLVAGLLAGGLFVLHDQVVPGTTAEADRIEDEIRGRSGPRRGLSRGFVLSTDGQSLYHYESLVVTDPARSQSPPQARGLSVLRLDGSGEVHQILGARSAVWVDGQWLLRAGWTADILEDKDVVVEKFASRPLVEMEPPDYFASIRDDPDHMPIAEYKRFIEAQAAAGYPTASLRVHLHRKLSLPLAPIVLVLVALPFAFTTGRHGAMYGVGISLILGVTYYTAVAFFTALGSSELLPPLLSAWAPNVLFTMGGAWLLLHVRT